MPTPAQVAQKFNREWIASKDVAKTNYAAQAANIPDLLVAAKATMKTNYAAAIDGGKIESGIAPYRNNSRLQDLHAAALDAIDAIEAPKLAKVERDVELKRYLGGLVGPIITLLKAATSGNVTVPTGLTDDAISPIIIQAINKNQNSFSSVSSAATVLSGISADLTTLGFPNAA